MHENTLFSFREVLTSQRIDDLATYPVRAGFDGGTGGVSPIIELGAELGHAIHVDALIPGNTKAGLK